jgi:mannose-6-phosphate isomerase-like protein (cupin superfamily)
MISRTSAPHYVWGGVCDGWRLLTTPDLSVIEERMPPGSTEVEHLHRRARQFFYVLEGELSLALPHGVETLRGGEGLEIAPGTSHRAFNPGPGPCRFLVVSNPPTTGDRLENPPGEDPGGTPP